jgi:hypothetical protein
MRCAKRVICASADAISQAGTALLLLLLLLSAALSLGDAAATNDTARVFCRSYNTLGCF